MMDKVSLVIKWSVVAMCILSLGYSFDAFFRDNTKPVDKIMFLVVNAIVQAVGIKGVYNENCFELYIFAIMLFNSLIIGHSLALQLFYLPVVNFALIQITLAHATLLKGEQTPALPN